MSNQLSLSVLWLWKMCLFTYWQHRDYFFQWCRKGHIWCRKGQILCRNRRIHFEKKKQVFTLGAENEQKFGAVNGCRNWWTPYKFIAPIGEKLASKSKLGDKWSKRKKMSLTSFTRHHLFFQVKIFYQSWNKKKFRIPSLSHALFYSATSILEHMKS